MSKLLASFRNSLLPHVLRQRAACNSSDFGCLPRDLANVKLREWIEQNELLRDWLFHCVPRVPNKLKLGVGCDPKPLAELDCLYGDECAIPGLIIQRIFVFAEDGSGYPYCLHIDRGEVYRAWSAWGGDSDKQLADVIDMRWPSIESFTAWLEATLIR